MFHHLKFSTLTTVNGNWQRYTTRTIDHDDILVQEVGKNIQLSEI